MAQGFKLNKQTLMLAGVGVGAAVLLYLMTRPAATPLPIRGSGVDLSGRYPGSLGPNINPLSPGYDPLSDPNLDLSGGISGGYGPYSDAGTVPSYSHYPTATAQNIDPNIGGIPPAYVDLSRSITPNAPTQPAYVDLSRSITPNAPTQPAIPQQSTVPLPTTTTQVSAPISYPSVYVPPIDISSIQLPTMAMSPGGTAGAPITSGGGGGKGVSVHYVL